MTISQDLVIFKVSCPSATTNYSGLRSLLASLRPQECCGLWPQPNMAAYGLLNKEYNFKEDTSSGAIIEYIGNIHIFTLSLAIMSTRFISYYFIRNPWLFLPVEILHSISYGLFYPNMSAYANKIAPTGRHATMQGLVSSMFKVGTSLGALIGGAGFKLFGGAQMFLYVGCADIFFMVIYVICHMLLNRRTNASGNDDENKGEINLNFKEEIPYKSHQVSTPGRGNGYGTIDI